MLKVLKPLYSILETRNYWFKIYHAYYVKNFNMTQLTYDLYLLYSNKLFSIVGLQINNILFLTDKTFVDIEENKLYKVKFIAKEWERLTIIIPLKFNRAII